MNISNINIKTLVLHSNVRVELRVHGAVISVHVKIIHNV